MEHEITDISTRGAKRTLTKIVKYNSAFCAIFAAIWAFASLLHQHANPLTGLSGFGFLLGLIVTISALNVRLRVELEEPDSAE